MFEDHLFQGQPDMFAGGKRRHPLRRIAILAFGLVAAYFVARYRTKQADSHSLSSRSAFTPVIPPRPTTPPATPVAPATDDSVWQKMTVSDAPQPEPIVDVTEPEIVGEFVVRADEITDDTEIDLALEEEIENGDLDDDFTEGVLSEEDDEDLEESILEPSAAPEETKWVAPENGQCPDGYPIKARFSTGRFHLPEDRGYKKIKPDCCYASVEDAEADGFTHSRWS